MAKEEKIALCYNISLSAYKKFFFHVRNLIFINTEPLEQSKPQGVDFLLQLLAVK